MELYVYFPPHAFLVWTGTTQPSAFHDDADLFQIITFQFPAVDNIKMAERQACELGVNAT